MKKLKKGFTLVELMIVIAIIATLSTVSIIGYRSFVRRENINASITEAEQVREIITSQVVADNDGVIRIDFTGGSMTFTYEHGVLQISSTNPSAKSTTIDTIKSFDKAIRKAFPSISSLPGTLAYEGSDIYYHHISMEDLLAIIKQSTTEVSLATPGYPYDKNDVAVDIVTLDFITFQESGSSSDGIKNRVKFSLGQSTIFLERGKTEHISYTIFPEDTEIKVIYDSEYISIGPGEPDEDGNPTYAITGKKVSLVPVYVKFTAGNVGRTLRVKIIDKGRRILKLPYLNRTIEYIGDNKGNGTPQKPNKEDWVNFNENIMTLYEIEPQIEPGPYSATFCIKDEIDPETGINYRDEYCWEDDFTYEEKDVTWRISKKQVNIPTQINIPTYNGLTRKPDWDSNYDANIMSVKLDANLLGGRSDPGNYGATFSLKYPRYYEWSNPLYKGKMDAEQTWRVNYKEIKSLPYLKQKSYEYTGSDIGPGENGIIGYDPEKSNSENGFYIRESSSELTGKKVKNYSISLAITDSRYYSWPNQQVGDLILEWEITPHPISMPSFSHDDANEYLEYTGDTVTANKFNGFDGDSMSLNNNTGNEAGTYEASIKPDENHVWKTTGTRESVKVPFTINQKAISVPTVKTTNTVKNKFTFSGNKLSINPSTDLDYYIEAAMNVEKREERNANTNGYPVKVSLKTDANGHSNYIWKVGNTKTLEDQSINWIIYKAKLPVPTITGTYIYNGKNQTPQLNGFISGSMSYIISNNSIASPTCAGSHEITFKILEPNNFEWDVSKDATSDQTIIWTIEKAGQTITADKSSLEFTSKDTTGKVITISGNATGATISATSNDSTNFPVSVSGNKVTVKCNHTRDDSDHTATITISSGSTNDYKQSNSLTISVKQKAREAQTMTVSSSSVSFNSNSEKSKELTVSNIAENAQITLTNNNTTDFNATYSNGTISIKCKNDRGDSDRTAKLTLSSAATDNYKEKSIEISVTQKAREAQTITADKSSLEFTSKDTTGKVITISGNATGATISATSSDSTNFPVSVSGNKVTVKCSHDRDDSTRTAKITITSSFTEDYKQSNSITIDVTQKAKSSQTITSSLDDKSNDKDYDFDGKDDWCEIKISNASSGKIHIAITGDWLQVKVGNTVISNGSEITNMTFRIYSTQNRPASDSQDKTGKVTVYAVANDEYLQSNSIEFSLTLPKESSSCITDGTLITMADGSYKKVEDLTVDDYVLVFNHETGKLDNAKVNFIESDGWKNYNVINLEWSNNKKSGIIYEHGFFDLDLMKYVYIHEDDYADYIGHRFYDVDGNAVTLENAYITNEYRGCYSFPSEYHLNFFMEDMLSMPGGITGMFNIFDYDSNLKFNEEKMKADIEEFGLFDYSIVSEFVDKNTFKKYPTKYVNVSIGKGIMTEEEFYYLVERYAVKYETND